MVRAQSTNRDRQNQRDAALDMAGYSLALTSPTIDGPCRLPTATAILLSSGRLIAIVGQMPRSSPPQRVITESDGRSYPAGSSCGPRGWPAPRKSLLSLHACEPP